MEKKTYYSHFVRAVFEFMGIIFSKEKMIPEKRDFWISYYRVAPAVYRGRVLLTCCKAICQMTCPLDTAEITRILLRQHPLGSFWYTSLFSSFMDRLLVCLLRKREF